MEFRNNCCCFTGHRPEKLNISEEEAKRLLCIGIQTAIDRGFTTFITGMAKGIDVWAGEVVLKYKQIYPHIKLVCALPYPTFFNGRKKEERDAYRYILSMADITHISFSYYDSRSYQSRNIWMVDHSSLVIAFYTGEPGGTRNTIKYAQEQNIEILNLLN